ncbi:hypothetical protein [Actinophytocola glycyrrhizae]|uniref:Uncharacterized protein n=1 Tax=Actinophytocola glycyrrhizae TaxID=2044873 RepID=A0ABV9S8D9_9PSEU
MDHLKRLLIAAINERSGHQVGSDELIRTALDALIGGVDTPALRQLAGLTRGEEPEAHDLFEQVIHELDLAPSLPDHPADARWVLIRWWCRLIVDGDLSPVEGGQRISTMWSEVGYADAIRPIVGAVSQWEDWTEHYDVARETCAEEIVAAAQQLLDRT